MTPKRIGRPPLAGRWVLVKLTETNIAQARELGAGNMSKGIRDALKATQDCPSCGQTTSARAKKAMDD